MRNVGPPKFGNWNLHLYVHSRTHHMANVSTILPINPDNIYKRNDIKFLPK